MADEIRATHQPAIDADATITPATRPADAEDPSLARAQIEKTRARMSETIDEIEEVLVRKKERLQDRLDFMAPVRENPLVAAGAVFGAGLLLGLLTGGGDDSPRGFDDESEMRAETWEHRARRLMRIAREQEEELEALAGRRGRRFASSWSEDEEGTERADHASGGIGDEIADRITGFVTDAIHGMFGTRSANA